MLVASEFQLGYDRNDAFALRVFRSIVGSLQKQVELFYDVQLAVFFDDASERLVVTNNSHGQITIIRVLISGEENIDTHYANPQIVAANTSYFFLFKGIKEFLKANLPKDGRKQYGLTLFVKNEKEEKVTVSGNLIAVWFNAFRVHLNYFSVMPCSAFPLLPQR